MSGKGSRGPRAPGCKVMGRASRARQGDRLRGWMQLQQSTDNTADRGSAGLRRKLRPGGEVGRGGQCQAQHGWMMTAPIPEGQTEGQGQGLEHRAGEGAGKGGACPPRSLKMESMCTQDETGSHKET